MSDADVEASVGQAVPDQRGGSDAPAAVWITPRAGNIADVTQIVLRESERVRLLFLPQLVINPQDSKACLNGCFVYQRKNQRDAWEDAPRIKLSELRSGEGVRIDIKSSELRKLFGAMGALYDSYEEEGLGLRPRRRMLVDPDSGILHYLKAVRTTRDSAALVDVLNWVNAQDSEVIAKYFGSRGDRLTSLDNALGIARLQDFATKATALLDASSEDDWQQLLRTESWAIGQLYAEPVVIMQNQPYVGGKGIDNRGGSVADFLYRNSLSDNCMIVEIKTPGAPLIVHDKHARNGVFNVSADLAGATQQIIQSRYTLGQQYQSLRGDGDPTFRVFSPRLLLIIGRSASLGTVEEQRSFDFYRGNLRDVSVVTFDELVEKVQALLSLLRSTI